MNALSLLIGAVAIVGVFLILVIPHELGHFSLAKLVRVRIHEYSVGMGPQLFSFRRGETLYALRALPIGGYVRLAGMQPGEYDDPRGFYSVPVWKKLLILVAGAAVNFLVAAALMTGVYLTQVNHDPGLVEAVTVSGPAYQAGLRPGDRMQAADGQPLRRSDDLLRIENDRPGQPLTLDVVRQNGSRDVVQIQPAYDSERHRWLIGVSPRPVVSAADAVGAGVSFPVRIVVLTFQNFAALFTGQIPGGLYGPNGVTGAVGIGAITYQAANQGLVNYLAVAAYFSVALGLANLLPLPALDGGHMTVAIAEAVRRRPFDRTREAAVQRAGLLALLALGLVVVFLDLHRLLLGQLTVR